MPDVSNVRVKPNQHPYEKEVNGKLMSQEEILSQKLVAAIERQAALDDKYATEVHRNEALSERIRELEAKLSAKKSFDEELVKFHNLEEKLQLTETKCRNAESEKSRVESELEDLTSSLFEEANRMVANARKETVASEKRVNQLKKQLVDAETLLSSTQHQLTELKDVMHSMSDSHEQNNALHPPLSRTTSFVADNVSVGSFASSTSGLDILTGTSARESLDAKEISSDKHLNISGERPATFPNPTFIEGSDERRSASSLGHRTNNNQNQLIRFSTQIRSSSTSPPRSPLIISDSPSSSIIHNPHPTHPSASAMNYMNPCFLEFHAFFNYPMKFARSRSAYSTSANYSNTPPRNTVTPSTARSSTLSQNPSSSSNSIPLISRNLRDFSFFKRCLEEDIEPTLRLDHASGLSWLTRRSVFTAILESSLIINPLHSTSPLSSQPCSLCGFNRTQPLRQFEFRSRPDSTSHASCTYCVARLRSVCNFVAFLHQICKGVWSSCSLEKAWDECLKKREAMFLSRVGLAKELEG
ncbi:Rab guanine nucleotide exchange factor sec2 [Schizosaccharomyces pombe]